MHGASLAGDKPIKNCSKLNKCNLSGSSRPKLLVKPQEILASIIISLRATTQNTANSHRQTKSGLGEENDWHLAQDKEKETLLHTTPN